MDIDLSCSTADRTLMSAFVYIWGDWICFFNVKSFILWVGLINEVLRKKTNYHNIINYS